MKTNSITILLIALVCLTPCLGQIWDSHKLHHFKDLNQSVKAILGSVIDTFQNPSDNSDEGITDDYDDFGLKQLFAEPEENIKAGRNRIEDVFTEVFGKDNKFFEGLMEMVAVNIENLHDHANKFVDISNNETKARDFASESVLNGFKDFHGAIVGIIDHILTDSIMFNDDEYIVTDKRINKLILEENRPEEENLKENTDNEENRKVKNGLRTVSFIKERLAERKHHNVRSNKNSDSRREKVLRRQNAMKPKDFENYFKDERVKEFLDLVRN